MLMLVIKRSEIFFNVADDEVTSIIQKCLIAPLISLIGMRNY